MAARVIDLATRRAPATRRTFTCPVCFLDDDYERASTWHCHDRDCDAVMHLECYWGRVATLDEWREWLRRSADPTIDIDDVLAGLAARCPACRARERGGA